MIAIGGENLIDLVSAKQTDNEQPHYVAMPGGSPFNVAMAAGRQGYDVTYLSPISSDAFGDLLATRLVESHVAIAAPRVQQPTSLAIVSLDSDGAASYSFHRNGTAERQVTCEKLASYMPRKTDIFHVGGLALIDGDDADAWKMQFQLCKNSGILTSLDPNVRPALVSDRYQYMARLSALMKIADIVKLSDEDLEWLYPDRPLEQALRDCRADCNAALFILTLGAKGAHGFVDAGDVHIPSAKTDRIIDTVGAGDTFMATILSWVVETDKIKPQALRKTDMASLKTALSGAAKAAAMNCEQSGCNPPWRYQLNEAMPS
jgi:fructokinase